MSDRAILVMGILLVGIYGCLGLGAMCSATVSEIALGGILLGLLIGGVMVFYSINRIYSIEEVAGATSDLENKKLELDLRNLDALKAKGLITEAEYDERRKLILSK